MVTRFSVSGTQQGEFAGIPPTSKFVQITGINIHRVRDRLIEEAVYTFTHTLPMDWMLLRSFSTKETEDES